MTAKARANRWYKVLLLSCLPGAMLFGLGQVKESGSLTIAGAALTVAYLVLAACLIRTFRCPHCRRHIDLRGPAAYCPKCGRWIPTYDGEPPAILSTTR